MVAEVRTQSADHVSQKERRVTGRCGKQVSAEAGRPGYPGENTRQPTAAGASTIWQDRETVFRGPAANRRLRSRVDRHGFAAGGEHIDNARDHRMVVQDGQGPVSAEPARPATSHDQLDHVHRANRS